jgi:Protein of unknown function (DUF559)
VATVSPLNDEEGRRPRPVKWEGMTFRSTAEYRLAKAFDEHGVWFIPNARGRIGRGVLRSTREVDLLVNIDGVWVGVEVDGQPWHTPSRATHDNQRDRVFLRHGLIVMRFDAEEAYNDPKRVLGEVVAYAQAWRRAHP